MAKYRAIDAARELADKQLTTLKRVCAERQGTTREAMARRESQSSSIVRSEPSFPPRYGANPASPKPNATKVGPIEVETLPESIQKISQSLQALTRLGLNRKAIVVLTAHHSKVPQREIKTIFDSLASLEKEYCR